MTTKRNKQNSQTKQRRSSMNKRNPKSIIGHAAEIKSKRSIEVVLIQKIDVKNQGKKRSLEKSKKDTALVARYKHRKKHKNTKSIKKNVEVSKVIRVE